MSLFQRVSDTVNPDRLLQMYMGSFIQATQLRSALRDKKECWKPGKPLKILLASYVGARNTGADVRVEEMIRQFRHIIGDENLNLTIMVIDSRLTEGYFQTTKQIQLPQLFPKFLYRQCPSHHGVVACEGSMFKSKFTDILSTMMVGALGLANTEEKLSVGYGAEAGNMTPRLKRFVSKHCKDSFIICRNEPSRKILEDLGIRTASGTDTAWTFEPSPTERGKELLQMEGWDGSSKILVICPINPFWWPVRPNLMKATARQIGFYEEEHYKSIYFHEYSEERKRKYKTYIDHLAFGVTEFLKQSDKKVFPVLVGMEQLDRRACLHLARRLPYFPAIFTSDEYSMYDIVSVLRHASLMISSRYHAIVTSMPSLVPSIGVTMDERIENLMKDRGHTEFLFTVDEETLGERLFEALKKLDQEKERVSHEIGEIIPKQLKLMGEMGMDLVDEIKRVYPKFPQRKLPSSWEYHLPPLPNTVRNILEKYA